MFYVNKVAGWLTSPLGLAFLGMVATAAASVFRRRVFARLFFVASLLWLWFWSTPLATRFVGAPLESAFLKAGAVPAVADSPSADVIVVLGGGVASAAEVGGDVEMHAAADRVRHAARLWKAGKAPTILVMGTDSRRSNEALFRDFGVATNAVVFAEDARNTEEELKRVCAWASGGTNPAASAKTKVLLVTSAWHMRRALLMVGKYAPTVEIVAAPTDFEATLGVATTDLWQHLLPGADGLCANSLFMREWIGYWGYRFLR